MEALLAFAAALVALRLAGALVRKTTPPRLAWGAGLGAYATASAALAWGAAAGWDDRAFRVYYLCGGLLTAPLLGAGSLLLVGRRWAAHAALFYAGLAIGSAVAVQIAPPVAGTSIPDAAQHLDFVPVRLLAVLGNSLGTLALVGVALATFRSRPRGNAFILAGTAVAAAGSAVAGLGVAESAAFALAAVVLLYAGFSA